ncbi:hypothetical protein H0H92_006027, partial [Tricholoma furcatifolium]
MFAPMYSYSHFPTSYPDTLVSISARERYLGALEEVRAAEANYLAAEAARREEEIIARRLAQIEMRRQAELLRAANYIDLYQADYAPFPVYAQRRGFEAGLNACHHDNYYHDVSSIFFSRGSTSFTDNQQKTFPPSGYMRQNSSYVTPPVTLGSTARPIAHRERLEQPVYIQSPPSRTAPSVPALQQSKHLGQFCMARKPLRPVNRTVEVPAQTDSKSLDAVEPAKQTQFVPGQFPDPSEKLLKSFAALFGVDIFDHPAVQERQQGPVSSTTQPEAPAPIQTVRPPSLETPNHNASALRELLPAGVGASEGQPTRQAPTEADQHESVPSQSQSQPATSMTFSTSANPASPELKSSFSKIRAIETAFNALKASFTLPAELDFVPPSPSFSETAPSDPEASNVTDHLSYSPLNRPVRSYEQALTVLLTELDSVESLGDASVRKSRKEVVERVEKALEELERDLEGRWKIRVTQSEPNSVGADVVPELVDLDTAAEAKEVDDNEPVAVAGQESAVEFDEAAYVISNPSPSLVNHGSPAAISPPSTSTTSAEDATIKLETTNDIVEAVLDAKHIDALGFSSTALPAVSDASSVVNDPVGMISTEPSESIVKRNPDWSLTRELHVDDTSASTAGDKHNAILDDVRVDNDDVDEWQELFSSLGFPGARMRGLNSLPLDDDILDKILLSLPDYSTLRATILASKSFYRVFKAHTQSIIRSVAYNIAGIALPHALKVIRPIALSADRSTSHRGAQPKPCSEDDAETAVTHLTAQECRELTRNAEIVNTLEDHFSSRFRHKDRTSNASVLSSSESLRFQRAMYRLILFAKTFTTKSYEMMIEEEDDMETDGDTDEDDTLQQSFGREMRKRINFLRDFATSELHELLSAALFLVEIAQWVDIALASIGPSLVLEAFIKIMDLDVIDGIDSE